MNALILTVLLAAAAAEWGNYRDCDDFSCEMCWGSTKYFTGVRTRTAAPLPPDYAGTPKDVVNATLERLGVDANDIVSDLGCGDGRWLVAAAKRGAVGWGYERDADLAWRAELSARSAGVGQRVRIAQVDLMRAKLDDTTLIVLYHRRALLEKLLPKLLKLDGGQLIASYLHRLPGVEHQHTVTVGNRVVYVYVAPIATASKR